MITKVLTTINDLSPLIAQNKTENSDILLIGYADNPLPNIDVNDVVVYLGSSKNVYNWGKYVLDNLELWLLARLVNVSKFRNQLSIGGQVIVRHTNALEAGYSSTLIIVKVNDGVSKYGITGPEVYQMIMNVTDMYLELTLGKKGDL